MSDSFPLVVSVTSGKGGVGKTNLSVNLAVELAKLGKKVVLIDADLGLANVDVVLGLTPQKKPLPPLSRRGRHTGHSLPHSLRLFHTACLFRHEQNAGPEHGAKAGTPGSPGRLGRGSGLFVGGFGGRN